MKNFYLIGLLGSLGSGKSTVRKMLEQLGAQGIDADALAHIVMQRGTPTWRNIVNAFGTDILAFNGRIDRRQLGARVFADPIALQKLESLTHPAVRALTVELLRKTEHAIVVLEAIKLVEGGLHHRCDALWAVTCSTERQIERVMRTRHISADEARARLAAQGSFDQKLALADVVIDNRGDEQATLLQVQQVWKSIQVDAARDKSEWLLGIVKPAPVIEPKVEPTVVTSRAPEPRPTIPAPPPLAPTKTVPTSPVGQPSEQGLLEFEVRRTRRSDLDLLAAALAQRDHRSQPLTHDETLKRFGERGYRIALAQGRIGALAAWEAENLVAAVREIWGESPATAPALPQLFALIETEAKALLCEVSILMIESSAPAFIPEQAHAAGYEPRELNALHPVWRQVAQERLQTGETLWVKRLREDLITKPF